MKRIILLMGLVGTLVTQSAALNLHWEGAGSGGIGVYEDPANWRQGRVAGADDLAAFNNNEGMDFAVTFNSDVTNAKVSLRVPAPEYETLFVMNQHVWTVTESLVVCEASGGLLAFTNGTLRTETGNFSPYQGGLVTNLNMHLNDVNCEMTNAIFGAITASFEGGCLHISDNLSVGVTSRGAGTLKLGQSVQCNVTNTVLIGASEGTTGEVVNINSAFHCYGSRNALYVGKSGCGLLTLMGGSTYVPNVTIIGTENTSDGSVLVTGGYNTFGDTSQSATLAVGSNGKGSLVVGGGTNTTGGTVHVGNSSKAVGEITVTNGLMTIGRFLHIGYRGSGALNVTGGEMRFVNSDAILSVGRYAGGTGTVSVSGGVLDVNGKVWLGGSDSSSDPSGGAAWLTLAGNGVLRTKTVMERDANATSQVLFDGGTLRAAASGTLIQPLDDVRLTGKGLVVDTDGYDVSAVPTLQNADGEAGGITKKGLGTLTLTGTRAATGSVSVLDGTLAVSGNVKVSAGISRIDGVLSLETDKRLVVESGAALAGTGSVARVTLADNAVLARSGTEAATDPLNVSDCTANGHLRVALSGYALTDLVTSLPLLKVPTATFVAPTSTSVTLNGVSEPSIVLKYTQSNDATTLSVKYNSATLIIVR